MIEAKRRLKKSQYPYLKLRVGEVVVWKAPFGPNDIWGVAGGQWSTGVMHKQAILHAERKLGAVFNVHYGPGFIRITRVK